MTLRSADISAKDILVLRSKGLYCPMGDFYIDPVSPVERALITHGHADHARAGHGSVLATRETLQIMAIRYGENFTNNQQVACLGQTLKIGDVAVTFYPAGHILGSAQILLQTALTRIVASGDYKRQSDPTCLPMEVVACDVFITEATFGLPIFRFDDAQYEISKLIRSLSLFPDRAHLVGVYSLGKAQRIMAHLREAGFDRPVYIHGAMQKLVQFYEKEGQNLGVLRTIEASERSKMAGEVILCPPGSLKDIWSRKFPDPVTAFASGWMRTKARARQRGIELPLVISDHADWPGLCATILETGASEIWVTHGQEDALVHWCQAQGLLAKPLNMIGYSDEGTENSAEQTPVEELHS